MGGGEVLVDVELEAVVQALTVREVRERRLHELPAILILVAPRICSISTGDSSLQQPHTTLSHRHVIRVQADNSRDARTSAAGSPRRHRLACYIYGAAYSPDAPRQLSLHRFHGLQ